MLTNYLAVNILNSWKGENVTWKYCHLWRIREERGDIYGKWSNKMGINQQEVHWFNDKEVYREHFLLRLIYWGNNEEHDPYKSTHKQDSQGGILLWKCKELMEKGIQWCPQRCWQVNSISHKNCILIKAINSPLPFLFLPLFPPPPPIIFFFVLN